MTAIAYRDGVLVADRQVTFNNLIEVMDKTQVVHTAKFGKVMLALAGSKKSVHELIEWIETNNGSKPGGFDDMVAAGRYGLLITKDKTVHSIFGDGYVGPAEHSDNQFFTEGSGGDFCSGAMAWGANAIEAVSLACEHCEYCGMGYTVLNWSEVFQDPWLTSEGIPF